ncbi:MAG: hemolysin family protein [Chloroflexi bacterium]|nr:hemolysin family protein [Chloroflexota bacterium]
MDRLVLYLIVGLLVLILDLASAAARTALRNASKARLLAQPPAMEKRAQQALALLRVPLRAQAALALTQMIWRFTLAGLLLAAFAAQPQALLAGFAALLAAALLLHWLEWSAGMAAGRKPEAWALRLAGYVRVIALLFGALAGPANPASNHDHDNIEDASSQMVDEVKTLVDAGQQEGLLELGEQRMIHSIFALGDRLAREIMIPRIDIFALDVQTPLAEALDALLTSGYTRVPVYQDTVDHLLGLLYAKDLLRVWRRGEPLESLKDLLRAAYFVPEAKRIDDLLAEMQAQRVHMAIVVDEYGGVAGLVTMEDIVEEILGEIQDEYDLGEESPYQELPEGQYIFLGRVDLDDFNEVLDSHLPKEEADTLGGFIYSKLGRAPSSGETLRVDDLLLSVEQVSGRRIRKVRVARQSPADEEGERPTGG